MEIIKQIPYGVADFESVMGRNFITSQSLFTRMMLVTPRVEALCQGTLLHKIIIPQTSR